MSRITVTHLGKAYKKYPSRWARLAEWVSPRHLPRHSLQWILQDINFAVNQGEAVGIIGMNGAGKSTLLKMITGTTQPTTGRVEIRGRVAALLELGMGFHPDFSGRQNVYMAGQLLGYEEEQITQLMPEIEAFADIGEYLDQPVRVYSSGMQVRLAFSVATAQRPEVLIVDEALSVGDVYFQHKSFDRIREFRDRGTTLLLVSHDKASIQAICDRAILLNSGRIAMEGEPEIVMDYYNALLADHQEQIITQERNQDGQIQTVSGNGDVRIVDAVLLDEEGQRIDTVGTGQNVTLRVKVACLAKIEELSIGYMIKDRLGQVIFGTNTSHYECKRHHLNIKDTAEYAFSFQASLGPGSYSVTIACHADANHIGNNYEWRDRALIFNVINYDKPEFVGVAWIPPTIRTLS